MGAGVRRGYAVPADMIKRGDCMRRNGQTRLLIALFVLLGAVGAGLFATSASAASASLMVSTSPDRSSGKLLQGATLNGSVSVFVPAAAGITSVTFWLDNPTRVGIPHHVENGPQYDFNGTARTGAKPWNTTDIVAGTHSISADVTTNGVVTHLFSTFILRAPTPTSFVWAPIKSMPAGTTEAESVVIGDQLYLFGGFDLMKPCCTPTNRAWRYNPDTNVWAALANMPENGISHAGIATNGRYIWYMGGYAANAAGTGQVYGTTHGFRYDVTTNKYTAMPNLPQSRAAGGMAYVNGVLYYFGGGPPARTTDSGDVWSLNVADDATTWVPRASMPNPRNHLGWGVIGGKIFAVGGQHLTNAKDPDPEMDRYDPVANTWIKLAPLPIVRSHEMDSTSVLDGRLVVAGGAEATGKTDVVDGYNPATNTWATYTSLPERRTSTTVRGLPGHRLIFVSGSGGTSSKTGWLGAGH
jgi:N-acetylneuraminic acid mutarotase